MSRHGIWLILALALFLGSCCEAEILTTSLPDGIVGQSYNARIRADCVTDPDWFLDGQLPPGLAFSAHDDEAEIEGVPQQAGDFSITVTVISYFDSGSETVSRAYLIRVLDN